MGPAERRLIGEHPADELEWLWDTNLPERIPSCHFLSIGTSSVFETTKQIIISSSTHDITMTSPLINYIQLYIQLYPNMSSVQSPLLCRPLIFLVTNIAFPTMNCGLIPFMIQGQSSTNRASFWTAVIHVDQNHQGVTRIPWIPRIPRIPSTLKYSGSWTMEMDLKLPIWNTMNVQGCSWTSQYFPQLFWRGRRGASGFWGGFPAHFSWWTYHIFLGETVKPPH